MKVLKIVIIILVVIIAIILIPPLFMPSQLNIERSKVLTAQPEVIWDQVNCLENWEHWDVWHQDTNMTGYYEGPACGEGAKNIWTYNNTDDGGSQTIMASRDNEYLKTFLDFQKMGTAESEMFLERTDAGTKVTWTLVSDAPYPVTRWINALMVAPGVTQSYDEGLENLENHTKDMEAPQKYTIGEISTKEIKAMDAVALRVVASMEEMATAMGNAYGKLMPIVGDKMAGPPFAIWYKWEGETFEFDNCIPTAGPLPVSGDIKNIKTYEGRVVSVLHTGAYETTYFSWEAIGEYMAKNNLESGGSPMEVYLTDPGSEPDPNKWVTELVWPIK